MSLRDELAAVLGPGNDDATAYAQADSVLGVLAQQPANRWEIVNGWLVEELPEHLQRAGSPTTGPEELLEPLVDLRTLPGFSGLRDVLDEVEGIPGPNYGPGELRRVADVLDDMPAPRGEQPREIEFAVRIPRLGDVVIGVLRWDVPLLGWTWVPQPPRPPDPTRLSWRPREGQGQPEGIIDTSRRRRA